MVPFHEETGREPDSRCSNFNRPYQMKKLTICFLLFLYITNLKAQLHPSFTRAVNEPSYRFFHENTRPGQANSQIIKYAALWAEKARRENNIAQECDALRVMMYNRDKKWLPLYADSLLAAAGKSPDREIRGRAWLTRGVVYYDRNEHAKALDSYLTADSLLIGRQEEYDIHKLKYAIANTKYYLGFYDEAIALFRQCERYFDTVDDRGYLNTLYSLGLCYNQKGQFEQAATINRTGLQQGARRENENVAPYFR
ncbi:MAG: tetratricopeptide repeat protein, partial [Sphingobacteriales bacterium]